MLKRITRSLALIALAVFALIGTGCYSSPENGKISVIRGDGLIEGHSGYKDIICPGDKQFIFNDETHEYPDATQQRTFKFNDDKDADSGPIENLRTADGVKVTLSGTVYFKTAFSCDNEEAKELLKKFDQANASRPDGQKPWEDFSGYLQNQWKPIIDSNAREVVSSFECAQVVSSCALLARDSDGVEDAVDDVDNQSNVQQIEEALQSGLVEQLNAKLGEDYFTDIQFNMEQPLLPEVDDAIAQAQAAFASVADARAERLRQAELIKVERQKKQVAEQRQEGYAACPSCARQDELEALPDGLTTYAPGGNFAVAGR